MTLLDQARTQALALTRPLLDYALPPRCPACGVIVSDVRALCSECWRGIDFIGDPLCAICGIELPDHAIDPEARCGACLADPPPFDRARAVMRYGETARTIAHRLKYGRRVSLAQVMAGQMMPLLSGLDQDTLLVPVPLHRWRIWSRGFNQAALIAGQIARRSGIALETDLLRRTVNTPPLHALGRSARRKTVKGAFALAPGAAARIEGRSIILVDDIWTTGATASACARVLRAGGAARVEILCWTRVGPGGV